MLQDGWPSLSFFMFFDGGLAVLFVNQGQQRNQISKQSHDLLLCIVPKKAARIRARKMCELEKLSKRTCVQCIKLNIT